LADPFSHMGGHTLAEAKILDTGKIDRYPPPSSPDQIRTKIQDFSQIGRAQRFHPVRQEVPLPAKNGGPEN
jgi:hypothetical protein